MKSEAQNQQDLFFFRANDQLAVSLEEQFTVRREIIETENYVNEAFIIHHYQVLNQWNSHMDATKKGEMWMRDFEANTEEALKTLDPNFYQDTTRFHAMDDDEDEDWDDDDDEEWDDDDADEDEWDEDEEDWDEDDEDWDEDEEDEDDFEEDEE